jgi:uncharacterized small protein (DUF1192 family)
MAIDELWRMTTGWVKGWKKGKLKEKLQETAKIAYDEKIKNIELTETLGQLQDEIKRLKGEKTKPKIKPANTNKDLNPKPKKKHKKREKKKDLEIDEVVVVDVDKEDLPPDAKSIGERDIVIQEIIIKRRNIKVVIKRYYSKELGKVFEGEVPDVYRGSSFGPQLISFVLYQYYKCRVPHDKIITMLRDFGIDMSAGTLCMILNDLKSDFSDDLSSSRDAALKKDSKVHIDDTGARINGVNGYTFGVSNRYFTQFTTVLEKNRWAAVGALLNGVQSFLVDQHALNFVANKLKKAKVTVALRALRGRLFKRSEFEMKLKEHIDFDVSKKELDVVRTACAISALKSREHGPPIRFLISDDGTNFKDLIKNHQLCWVHEIRKYKKMSIYHQLQQNALDEVVLEWQGLYKKMKNFKLGPTKKERELIRSEFSRIVSIKTCFNDIDEQLIRTAALKSKLLLFLRYPQLPLHNNLSENDIRERVIKRKISLQNRSIQGVQAWDLMLSLASTCRKLDLSFWRYLEDRISGRESIPYLGKLVTSH